MTAGQVRAGPAAPADGGASRRCWSAGDRHWRRRRPRSRRSSRASPSRASSTGRRSPSTAGSRTPRAAGRRDRRPRQGAPRPAADGSTIGESTGPAGRADGWSVTGAPVPAPVDRASRMARRSADRRGAGGRAAVDRPAVGGSRRERHADSPPGGMSSGRRRGRPPARTGSRDAGRRSRRCAGSAPGAGAAPTLAAGHRSRQEQQRPARTAGDARSRTGDRVGRAGGAESTARRTSLAEPGRRTLGSGHRSGLPAEGPGAAWYG